jgi:outer membrane protein TolC
MMNQRFIPNCSSGVYSRKIFLILLTQLVLTYSVAQKPGEVLSLSKALDIASSNYGEVKVKELYIQAQKAHEQEVKREYIPAFKLHGQVDYGTANSVPGTYFPYGIVVPISGGITNANNPNPVYGALGMGYVEWAPFSFGQYRARVQESDLELKLAGADADQERFYNKIYVTQAYLDALVAIRLLELQEKNLLRTVQVHDVISETAKNGLRPGVDTSFANSEVSKAKLNVLEAQKNEAEQFGRLADLLGIESINFSLDTVAFFQSSPNSVIAPAVDVTANPILKIYATRQSLSEIREKEIFRNYFPKISVLGVANGRGSGIMSNGHYDESLSAGVPLSRFNYAAGLACTFNILDYPRMRAEEKAEQFRTAAAKTELDEQTLNLKNEMTLANERFRIAQEQLKQAPIQYDAASDFYKQRFAMYQTGLSNIVDLSQALYNLSRAEADYAIARDAVWKALLLKASVSGDFNSFMNSIK